MSFLRIRLRFGCDPAAFAFHAMVKPLALLDIEEVGQHLAVFAPGFIRQSCDVGEHGVVIGQSAPAPQVKQQQQIGSVLFCAQVHCIGEVIADVDRHPDVGLTCDQSLGRVVLCPFCLIDSFRLVAINKISRHQTARKMPMEES